MTATEKLRRILLENLQAHALECQRMATKHPSGRDLWLAQMWAYRKMYRTVQYNFRKWVRRTDEA